MTADRSTNGPAPKLNESVPLDGRPEMSLLGIASVLLRQRYTLILVTLTLFVLGMLGALLTPRTWTSGFSFVSRTTAEGAVRLGGLAAQLGLPGIGPSTGITPEVYTDVVESHRVLAAVASARYGLPGTAADSGTLIDYLEIESTEPSEAVAAAVDVLRDVVGASVAARTGLVSVTVKLEDPDVAYQVARKLLEEVNEFNRLSRQEQARAERIFLENRLAELEEELRASEDRLQRFLERNREWQSAPGPRFAHERLERDVLLKRESYLALSQSYEQTRLSEIRDTPSIAVIDAPVRPANPDSRRLLVRAVLTLLLAIMAGLIAAFIRDRGEQLERSGDPEFAEFQALRSEVVHDVLFWRRRQAGTRSTPSPPSQ